MFQKPKTIKLAQTKKEFDAQAAKFLKDHGFPVDSDFLRLYGGMVQSQPQHVDEFDPKIVAAMMRKSIANEFAYYLMYPKKWEERQAELKKAADDASAAKEASSEVVQKVS